MSNVKYLTPKKGVSEIARERADQTEAQNIDLYEAVAGLYETISDLTQQNAALEKRVTTLEGGQNK